MRIIGLLVALALILLVAGCMSPAAPAADPVSVTVHNVRPYYVDNRDLMPASGYKLVAVDFSITNAGPASYQFNPVDTALRDPDQVSYKHAAVFSSIPGFFSLTNIPPGETRRGKLVFAVAENNPAETKYVLSLQSS